ncbi:hypothetical protein E2C01_071579 [Portunus trituberculatus]|uniref:Uncharacterized protein n=1 Tax=Portunus trituberculatus TaxID=210409 RepID=A0A5B7I8K5_PORTR|nr:hypothetical protein [Portunus trituberculatus]
MVLKGLRLAVFSTRYNVFLTPSALGTHFYLQFYARLDVFIDIRKGLWRSGD